MIAVPLFAAAHVPRQVRNTVVTTVLLWFLIVPPAIAQSLFATIGDFGDGSIQEGSVAGLVYGWNPDFVITMGDNRYGSRTYDEAVGQFYCDSLTDAGSGIYCSGGYSPINAFFPSLGNHDYTDGGGLNEYLNYFSLPGTGVGTSGTSGSERYYDFIRGPVHFFVIDSQRALNSASDKTAQMNWLQAQLAASSTPWQVVYFHHAPYSSSAAHGSITAMQWPFASWGADAVIAGHDHTYERIFADGIVYFVNGLGGHSIYSFTTPISGSQVRYNGDYGAMRVDANDAAITFEFINVSGSIIDTHTIEAGAAPSYELLCSADATVDGQIPPDQQCDGATFPQDLWVYLWPEGSVDSVDFYVDGVFSNTERLVPYELDARSPTSFSAGTHTVHAVVHLIGGGTQEVRATFTIGTTPTSYSLLCSEDDGVNGLDPDCNGGNFADGLWVYLWPEGNVDSVDFYVDGVFSNTERLVPYELDARNPTSFSAGTHTVRAVVQLDNGDTEQVLVTFSIDTAP